MGTLVGRAAMTRQVARIDDAWTDPLYEKKEDAKLGEHRSMIGVPLMRDGGPIGVIGLSRSEVDPFSDHEIELVTTFADQSVIAIENARLLNELRQRTTDLTEALEQQTATSEVLQVISGSAGDVEPVFATMLEKAVRICDATLGNIYRWDGEALHLLATHNTPPALAEARSRLIIRPGANSLAGRMLANKAVIHIADVAATKAYQQRVPETVAAVELGGVRTILGVPMQQGHQLIGSFTLYRNAVRPFSDKQIALVTNFANQAVIAIENARLLNELRQRTDNLTERTSELTESLEQQTATSDILASISGSLTDPKPVFNAIVHNLRRLFGARFATVQLLQGETIEMPAADGEVATEKIMQHYPRPLDNTSVGGQAMLTNQVVQYAPVLDNPVVPAAAQQMARDYQYNSIIAAPMIRQDTVVGAIVCGNPEPRVFDEKEVALIKSFAAQAVIAIENARLLTELRQRTDDLGRSVGELRALGDVSQAVNSTLDLQNVLETIVAKAVQLSATDAGAIYVYDERDREFHLRATYGMEQERIDALGRACVSVSEHNVDQMLAQRQAVQVADLSQEVRSPVDDIVLGAGYRARLVTPLFRGDDIVGMLVVRRRTPGAFPQNTVELMKTFAAQSAMAIQNAPLYANVEARTRELAQSLVDLRTAQNRLIQTEKLASLGQLTAGIAHEIKNPLNFVNNFSAVSSELIDELQEAVRAVQIDEKTRTEITELTEMLRGNLDKVVQHGKRADSIVKNMLLHSRQGSGEHRLVDVNVLVEESLNLAYHGARAEKQGFNVTLERSFDPAAGEADLFPQEITRVLLNLISNGFYAATKRKAETNGGEYKPTLSAATKNLGDSVEIRIRDNGTGIPAEIRQKMFNPFFTTKPAGEGTGLGLSISHDVIVKQHSGSIEVDSELGEFTEIRIVLPRTTAFSR